MYRGLLIFIVAKFALLFLMRGMLKLAIKKHEKELSTPYTLAK